MLQPVDIIPFRIILAGMGAPALGSRLSADHDGLHKVQDVAQFDGVEEFGVEPVPLVTDGDTLEPLLQPLDDLQLLLQELIFRFYFRQSSILLLFR